MNTQKDGKNVILGISAAVFLAVLALLTWLPRTGHAQAEHLLFLPLVVSSCPHPPCLTGYVKNADFELGNVGWIFYSPAGVVAGVNDNIPPHGGNRMAAITSYGILGIDPGYIEQPITVPLHSPAYLNFYLASALHCDPLSGGRCGGKMAVSINGQNLPFYLEGEDANWRHIVLNTVPYRGQTITLRISSDSYRDSIINYVDDFVFSGPPLPCSFTKTDPANASPNLPGNITLTWQASCFVNDYEYCIDTSNDNSCGDSWTTTSQETSLALTDLAPGTYFWQVRANNETGSRYADGETTWWSFTVPPAPGSFKKLGPNDGNTNQTVFPELSWESSSYAASYELCVDTTDDDACTSSWTSMEKNTTYSYYPWGLDYGTYYWQVRSLNIAGATYADGEANWWTFTIPIPPGLDHP